MLFLVDVHRGDRMASQFVRTVEVEAPHGAAARQQVELAAGEFVPARESACMMASRRTVDPTPTMPPDHARNVALAQDRTRPRAVPVTSVEGQGPFLVIVHAAQDAVPGIDEHGRPCVAEAELTVVSRRAFETRVELRRALAGEDYLDLEGLAGMPDASLADIEAAQAELETLLRDCSLALPDGTTIVVECLDADAFLAEWWSRARAVNVEEAVEAHNAFYASTESTAQDGGAR